MQPANIEQQERLLVLLRNLWRHFLMESNGQLLTLGRLRFPELKRFRIELDLFVFIADRRIDLDLADQVKCLLVVSNLDPEEEVQKVALDRAELLPMTLCPNSPLQIIINISKSFTLPKHSLMNAFLRNLIELLNNFR